jgi:hypothetical protein
MESEARLDSSSERPRVAPIIRVPRGNIFESSGLGVAIAERVIAALAIALSPFVLFKGVWNSYLVSIGPWIADLKIDKSFEDFEPRFQASKWTAFI